MIDLVSRRFLFIAISLLVILPGIIAMLLGGIKPGIDFTGGTRWEVLPKSADINNTETFQSALAKGGFPDSQVKGATLEAGNKVTSTFVLDLPGQLNDDQKSKLSEALIKNNLVAGSQVTATENLTDTGAITSTTPAATITGTTALTHTATLTGTTTAITGTTGITSTGTTTGTTGTVSTPRTREVRRYQLEPTSLIQSYEVGPVIGSELLGRAIEAIAIASLAILIYLRVVFGRVPNAIRYGICAIIALLHDVLVVVGIFAILGLFFGIEIDALFVTAMLTVIGFSVHDTIVVFDRVRENIMKRRFERFDEVVNYSLVQTLARSINTSVTVLLTLFALYLFGGASIRSFVLALLIGILSGTYSSIFNASMLLVIWENREWGRWFGGGAKPPATPVRKATAR